MAELIRFELIDLPVCRIIGRGADVENGQNPLPPLWSRCFGDGTFEKLEQTTDSLFPDALYDAADAYLDWCDEKRCIVGMVMKPGTVPPEGFDFAELPVSWHWGR